MDQFKKNKKFLMQYRITQQKIDELEEELARVDDQAYLQSQKLTGMPSSEPSNDFDASIVHKATLEQKINSLSVIAQEEFKNVLETILGLNNRNQRDVLELYFLYRCSLNEIAERLCFGYRTVTRIYGDGVRGIELA